jgi:release factor glutamine methyltransferase
MAHDPSAPSLAGAAADDVRTFTRELARAGFGEMNLERVACVQRGAFPFDSPYLFEPKHPASPSLRASALTTLIRLFQEGHDVPRRELDGVFSTQSLRLLENSGLLTDAAGQVRATVTLTDWKGLLIAADRWDRDEWNMVFQPNRSTGRMAAALPLLTAGAATLDIGTGSGVLALLLARQGGRAIAVDPNPRALEFLQLNATLNALPMPEGLVADHTQLGRTRGLDSVVFSMPSPAYQTDVIARGFSDAEQGWEVVRDFYRMLPGALAASGVAVLRHEVPRDCARDEASFVAHTRAPEDLQILYLYIDPNDPLEQQELARFAQLWPAATSFVFGHALIRHRRDSASPRVSFATFSHAEAAHYSARLHWSRVLSVPGWADAFGATA